MTRKRQELKILLSHRVRMNIEEGITYISTHTYKKLLL